MEYLVMLMFLIGGLTILGQFFERAFDISKKQFWTFSCSLILFCIVVNLVFHEPKKRPEGWTAEDEERRKAQEVKKQHEDEYFLKMMRAAEHLKKQGK